MEDALTSMFFGAFRREPTERRILDFLKKAEPIEGSMPDFARCRQVKYDDYEFWPRWPSTENVGLCEPDVFIRIKRDKEKPLYVLIEAKYHSGPTNHQLAKEWCHLKKRADEENVEPWMTYFTKDFGPNEPQKAIEEALDEVKNKKNEAANGMRISWLSWRSLSDLFTESHLLKSQTKKL